MKPSGDIALFLSEYYTCVQAGSPEPSGYRKADRSSFASHYSVSGPPIVLKITYSEITASSRSFLFRHPADVDLWSGGVSERPLPGSMLGPTFACVIATQFSHSRRGDRFWYELPNQPSSFTLGKTLSNSLPGGSRASQGLATNHSKCNEAAPSKIALSFSLF